MTHRFVGGHDLGSAHVRSGLFEVDFVEFPSTDAGESGRFFAEAFGWQATPYGPDYHDVKAPGVTFGFQSDTGERSTAPLVIIRTDDLAKARRDIASAGGIVTAEPFDFPGGRRFHFREPGGCELAVWQPGRRVEQCAMNPVHRR